MAKPPKDSEIRFWKHVDKTGDCWEWTASVTIKGGYGKFWEFETNRTRSAHSWIYEKLNGKLEPDLVVMHTCDNPKCVRPDHLVSGTRSDNTQDMIKKGRSNYLHLVLTAKQVHQMRKRYKSLPNFAAIAREFGIDKSYARRVILKQRWKHI